MLLVDFQGAGLIYPNTHLPFSPVRPTEPGDKGQRRQNNIGPVVQPNGIDAFSLAKTLHCNADYLGRVYRRVFRLTPASWKRRYCREHINA